MTLAEKVGQLFVFTWLNPAQAHHDLRLHPGGYIRIYGDALTTAREIAQIQPEARTPLIMAADLERGIGGTIQGAIEVVNAMALGATGDEAAAFDAGRIIGEEARAMGINMDYAPVLDVNSNPQNPVINTRSFGQNPDLVSRLGAAFVRGLHEAGVAACGKHFPGHGNTSVDSHTNLGTVSGSSDELRAVELQPFQAAIAAGVDAIMSAHLLVPGFEPDNFPATLSHAIMTRLLRDELGFKGVAVTDALDMGAIAKNFPPEIAVPMAVNAGCDQLIMPSNNALVVDILMAAVKRGDVTEDRLNEAVLRILTMKFRRGILSEKSAPATDLSRRLNTTAHRARVADIAEKSIAAIKAPTDVLVSETRRALVIELGTPQAERSYYLEPRSFSHYLAAGNNNVTRLVMPAINASEEAPPDYAPLLEQLREGVASHDVIVIATFAGIRLNSGTVGLPARTLADVRELALGQRGAPTRAPMVIASFGSPYAISNFPEADAVYCAFSETQASQRAMARVLRGEIQPHGVCPITLKDPQITE